MLPTLIIGAIALATRVVADGAAIVESLNTLSASSVELDQTVSEWSGELFDALPIVTQSLGLLKDTKDATAVANESEPLTMEEAVTLATAMQSLITDIEGVLTSIEEAKPKFDELKLGMIILLNLKMQKKETDNFSAALVEKIPESLQEVAQTMADQVAALFDKAIKAYNIEINLPFDLPFDLPF